MYGEVKTISQTVKKNVPKAQAVILFLLRPTDISEAMVYESV